MRTAAITVCALLACALLAAPLHAEEIRRIVVLGSRLEFNFDSILRNKNGRLDHRDIESLGVMVTDEYHKRGYTTCYVEKLVVTRDGTLEIHVRESAVLGITVSGVGEREAGEIAAILLPQKGELYNRDLLQERIEQAKSVFNLESIRVYPVNYRGSGDVFLSVKAEKKSLGRFFGVLGVDPIYGIMPELGYFIPGGDSALTLRARAGYRDGGLRKAEGDVRYARQASDHEGTGFTLGIQGGRSVEIWESRDLEYTVLSCAPYLGLGDIRDLPGSFLLWTNLFVRGTAARIKGYNGSGSEPVIYDTALVLDVSISNRYYLLDKREAVEFGVTVTGGRSDLEKNGYIVTTAMFKVPVSPVHWLRFIPRANLYRTSSFERYYWSYVFDKNLLGFLDDFTASRWKNTAGLDVEIELAPRFIYAGPFVNYGYYIDEKDSWRSAVGTGMKGTVTYKDIIVEAYYAWDAAESPSRGGLYIFAESSF